MTVKLPNAIVAQVDWANVSRRLTLFAIRRLGRYGSTAEAEEIAQEAIRRFLDPDYASWDQQKEPSLLRHLGSIVNGLIRNRAQRVQRRGVAIQLDEEMHTSSQSSPDDRAAAGILASRSMELLRARLGNDDVCRQLLELQIEGTTKASEQATRLGLAITGVYNARRRLAGHVAAVREALLGENDS